MPPSAPPVRTHASVIPAPALSWPLLVALLAFAMVMAQRQLFWDPDTYWHIATGRWMMAHGDIPRHDVFTHSMSGAPWTAHEWGAELVIAAVYGLAGWGGLQAFAAAVFALTLGILADFLARRVESVHLVIAVALAALLLITHLLVRPHLLAWPLLALWVSQLVTAAETRRTPPWLLLPVIVLWVNLHLSVMLGLAIAGGIAVDAVMQEATAAERLARARIWALFLAAATLATLLNPQGWHALAFTVQLLGMQWTAMVEEWQSANFQQFQLILLWMAVVFGLAFSGRLVLPWPRTVLLLVLLYLALKHQRHHSLLGLVSPFILATPFARRHAELQGATAPSAGPLDRLLRSRVGPVRARGLLLTAVLCAVIAVGRNRLAPPAPPTKITPLAALAAARRLGLSGNMFNAYAWGGYLIFEGVPVMVDGRTDLFGDPVMQELSDAMSLTKHGALEATLDKYHIAWTLLAPDRPSTELLDHLPNWTRVYTDSMAVIHVRRDTTQRDTRAP